MAKIRKAFKLVDPNRKAGSIKNLTPGSPFVVYVYNSITGIDQMEWDNHLGKRGMFDWNGMCILERSFTDNRENASNRKFQYFVARDQSGTIILMTFYIGAFYKEDIFFRASIPIALEKERKLDPNQPVSKGVFVGSFFTEGNHIYINKENPNWKIVFRKLINELYAFQEKEGASHILFCDPEVKDMELDEFMIENGLFKVDHIINLLM